MPLRTDKPPTHALEVINGDLVTEEVEEDVLESASVSVGEDEAITVSPLGVGGVGLEELGCEASGGSAASSRECAEMASERTEKDVGGGSHSHGSSGCSAHESSQPRNLSNRPRRDERCPELA